MKKPAANANLLISHYKQFFNDPSSVDVVFEIGANDLKDTRILEAGFPKANIYAFEPRISKSIKVGNRVKVYNKALSNYNKTKVDFYIPVGWEGASSLLRPTKEPGVAWTMEKEIRQVVVDVVTVNKFAKDNEIKKIDVVWMDVQGNELRVLEGMTDYLPDVKIIQTEAGVRKYYENHTLFSEIKSFLEDYGFEVVYNVLEGGRQFDSGVTWEFETDVIFVNKNKIGLRK